jgi:hypothetical protein
MGKWRTEGHTFPHPPFSIRHDGRLVYITENGMIIFVLSQVMTI